MSGSRDVNAYGCLLLALSLLSANAVTVMSRPALPQALDFCKETPKFPLFAPVSCSLSYPQLLQWGMWMWTLVPGKAQKDFCGATAAVAWQDNGHRFWVCH